MPSNANNYNLQFYWQNSSNGSAILRDRLNLNAFDLCILMSVTRKWENGGKEEEEKLYIITYNYRWMK